jgi:glycine cleavage system transcriptional repressor
VTTEFAVWTVGADRPGIVAAVTGVLFGMGCNLKDCSMTVLSTHFAMVMRVEGPDGLAPEALEAELAGSPGCAGLSVDVHPAGAGAPVVVEGDPYIVSVYGSDHPGIVHKISTVLADSGVNITDVNTRVIEENHEPVYAMLLEVTLPPNLDPTELDGALQATAAEVGVEASLRPADSEGL